MEQSGPMDRMRSKLFALFCAMLLGCAGGGTGDSFTAPPVPSSGLQLKLEPFDIDAHHEREIFHFRHLDQPDDLYVSRIEVFMRDRSHHFILYTADGGRKDLKEGTFDFFNTDDPFFTTLNFDVHEGHFVMGAQDPYLDLRMPEGVAIRLKAQDWMILNSHFINLDGEARIQGEVFLNLHTIPREEVRHIAVPIFELNPVILVPPGATQTTELLWRPGRDIRVLSLSSHMHRRGSNFTARIQQEGVRSDPALYTSDDWDHPDVMYFDPALSLTQDQGVHFTCTFTNDKKIPLTFGFTSEDEMCILLGYYYPEKASGEDLLTRSGGKD